MSLSTLPFFQHVRWRPDKNELRRFAISMLIGFTLLGLIAAWRAAGIGATTIILWSLGAALAAGASVPRLGRATYLAVYLPTSVIGFFVSHVVLALIFFLVFTPLGFLLRLMGKDPLRLRPGRNKAAWRDVRGTKDYDSYYRQF